MELGGPPFDSLSAAEHKDRVATAGQLEGGSRSLGFSVLSLDSVLVVCPWDGHHTINKNIGWSCLGTSQTQRMPPSHGFDENIFSFRAMARRKKYYSGA